MNEAQQRRLAAIVAADVVGYSRLMGKDESGTLAALRRCRDAVIDPLIAAHDGRIVKTMGDGLLLEFSSVVKAVTCAAAIQDGVAAGDDDDESAIRWRIGIHLGDVIVEEDDIFGDGVNIAARIEGLAETGGVAISDDAYRLVRDRIDLAWRDGGEHQVKNISRAVWVWRWKPGAQPEETHAAADPPAAVPDNAEKASIAVLALDNMSRDPEQDYFADGITEDIITELSRNEELLVISRNSTFTYKGKAVKVADVCRDLGVRHVLEGSVRKAGNRVRVTAQLIDGTTGGHVWADRFDRNLDDIFAVQDEVTQAIVAALNVKLTGSKPVGTGTTSAEAYDLFLSGREQHHLYNPTGYKAARRLYAEAIALDPNYAAPHAGDAIILVHHDFIRGSTAALDDAGDQVQRAASLNPDLGIVQQALNIVHLFKKEHDTALAAARRWLEIEPASADAHAALGIMHYFFGEPEKVTPLVEEAMRLNPFYPAYYTLYLGDALLGLERYEEAVSMFRRAVVRNPDSMAPYANLAVCYGHLGQPGNAEQALTELRRINPDFSLDWMRTFLPFKHEAEMDRLVDGLRKAGLEE